MKTLTATQARQNLGAWLQKAIRGEDIGTLCDGEVVALRPVKVYSEDYALQEYGLTAAKLARAEANIGKQLVREKAKEWDGTVHGLKA